jgi:hypothetical protein
MAYATTMIARPAMIGSLDIGLLPKPMSIFPDPTIRPRIIAAAENTPTSLKSEA